MQAPVILFIQLKQTGYTVNQLTKHLLQVEVITRTGRIFNSQSVPIKIAVFIDRLDNQIINRHPHRTAPVTVSTIKVGSTIPWVVLNGVFGAFNMYRIRM